MSKDLADLERALNEGGLFRTVGNVLELSFNLGQLQSLTPPTEIADDWNAGMERLESLIDEVSSDVQEEASLRTTRSDIAKTKKQVTALRDVIDQLE